MFGQEFSRLTDRSKKVMEMANYEVQRWNHDYLGPEHLLVGLVHEGTGVAANVLKGLNVNLKKVREEIEKLVGVRTEPNLPGQFSRTPATDQVITCAIEEAQNLNHLYVGTEHLLLGLLRDSENVACKILINLGLKPEDIRAEVLNLLGVDGGGDENVPDTSPTQPEIKYGPRQVKMFGPCQLMEDLNKQYAEWQEKNPDIEIFPEIMIPDFIGTEVGDTLWYLSVPYREPMPLVLGVF